MKKFSLLALLLFVLMRGFSQQEAQYTQFMYNKLSLNPAYAGSAEMPCISCIYRSQWIGFEGAPTSQVVNFHMPLFSKRVGIGASIAHDKLGPTNSYVASLIYAYRIKLNRGNTLSIGVKGTLKSYQIKWDQLDATHVGDFEIPMGRTNRVFPNVGLGVYYDAERFYVGVSVPTMLPSDLSYSFLTNNTDFGRERQHVYLMGGYLFDLNENIKFKPAALIKYVANAPMDLDLNATFIFMEKFWGGVSYRLGGESTKGIGESIDLLVQYQVSPMFRAGVAYDFTLSNLKDYSSGTAEIQLSYCFQPKKKNQRLTNPRFF